MPSVLVAFLHSGSMMIFSATTFHGGSCSHRLKQLEKWNRRVVQVLVMDASVPCGKFITEDLCVNNVVNNHQSDLEESYLKHELGAWNNAEETAEVLPRKDADDDLVIAKDNLGVEELGTAFDGVFHIQDIQQGASRPVLSSHIEKLGAAKVEKSFGKCATFPSKENTLLSPAPVDMMAESTCTAPAGQSFQKSQNASYSRSFSMPVSSLLLPIANAVASADAVLT